jgi:hypothetical protein
MPVISTFHISSYVCSEDESTLTVEFKGGDVDLTQTFGNGDKSVIQMDKDMAKELMYCLEACIRL